MQNSTFGKLRIASIAQESIVDGEGWRYVVFTQGCNHNCLGCHNPASHDFNGGEVVNIDTIITEIEGNPLLDGVTLSGGDPFFQAKDLISMCKHLKSKDYNIWAYTGFNFEEFIKFKNGDTCDNRVNADMIQLLQYIDVVVDGRFEQDKRTLTLEYRGSDNQRLVDVYNSLKSNSVVHYETE